MSESPAVLTVVFSSEIPGDTVILRAKRATDRGNHLRYTQEKIQGGGIFPGQTSDYPYKRFRVSTLGGEAILPRQKYTHVLVAAYNWPSSFTFAS